MLHRLITLLDSRCFYIELPVKMDELYKIAMDNLPIKDLLSVCDECDFTECVSKCYSNLLGVCNIVSDMGGDDTKIINVLDSYESCLKDLVFKFIVSPDHIAMYMSKLLVSYLKYESLLI